jgi:F-type H+-transporting ATPase subunit epsilon
MAEKTQFELVSPEKLLVSQPVDMVVVPGAEGNFGALPGHSPFISTLRPGVIEIFEADRVVDRLFVAGGFAEVTEDRVTVLAEAATPVASLDRAAIEADIRQLNEQASAAATESDHAALESRRRIAQAKLEALGTAA